MKRVTVATGPEGSLQELAGVLARGGVLAVPTESSYALATDPRSAAGVDLVYRIKGRPAGRPLPIVAADRRQIESLGARIRAGLEERLAAIWPAPLSLVLPLRRPIPAAAGGSTLAVRVPAHAGLLSLLARLDTPLTATSLNRSGAAPMVDPAAAVELLTGYDARIVDDGVLPGGMPSTLVRVEDGRVVVLREGRYPVDELRRRAAAEVVEKG